MPLVVDFQWHLSDICHGPRGSIYQEQGGRSMKKTPLSEKDFLNPEEAIELYGLSRRKFYSLLKEKKKNGFTALYGSRRLVIRKEFEKYLDGSPSGRTGSTSSSTT